MDIIKNDSGLFVDEKNEVINFRFIEIKDCGATCCPHCGADGRYIYTWIQNGLSFSAMAGCYKRLTGKLTKSDYDRYYELLAEKQAKNKPLNGWDKNIIRLMDYKTNGKYPAQWCDTKIAEVLKDRAIYLAKKRF